MNPIPPALAAAYDLGAIPPVRPLCWWNVIAHLKSWVRAEIELRLHGVGLRDREIFNP